MDANTRRPSGTCDIPIPVAQEFGISVVPVYINIGGQSYLDGIELTRAEFYDNLPGYRTPPTTSAPGIGSFIETYKRLAIEGASEIISIHAAGTLTTIINTARRAAQEFDGRILVVDSLSLSLGLGFQVLAAAESEESEPEAALAAIESTRRRLRLFAALDSMEYLRRSGRVQNTIALLGSLLNVKPLIEVCDGDVKASGVVRTTRQANERMAAFLRSAGRLERLAILHTGAEARAREFLNRIMSEISQSLPRDILMINATTVIGTHIGPNGLGFAAIRKE